MKQPKIVQLIFVSGKIVITRAKMRKETYTAFENIYTQFLQSSRRSSNNSIEGIPPGAANSTGGHAAEQVGSEAQEQSRQNASEHPSDHTHVWSELSGTGNNSVNGTEERPQGEGQPDLSIQGIRDMGISKSGPAGDNVPAASNLWITPKDPEYELRTTTKVSPSVILVIG